MDYADAMTDLCEFYAQQKQYEARDTVLQRAVECVVSLFVPLLHAAVSEECNRRACWGRCAFPCGSGEGDRIASAMDLSRFVTCVVGDWWMIV